MIKKFLSGGGRGGGWGGSSNEKRADIDKMDYHMFRRKYLLDYHFSDIFFFVMFCFSGRFLCSLAGHA